MAIYSWDLPIKNGDFPIVMLVYQAAKRAKTSSKQFALTVVHRSLLSTDGPLFFAFFDDKYAIPSGDQQKSGPDRMLLRGFRLGGVSILGNGFSVYPLVI